jgi:outer membrane immunogenic protein
LRGRLGILVTPSFLIYGTGGLAYGGVEANTTITETLGFSDTPGSFGTSGGFSGTRVGWTAGGGVEWMFAPRWSVKAEYLYYDLGTETWSLGNINQFGLNGALLETVSASQSKTRFNGNIARLGINWHF